MQRGTRGTTRLVTRKSGRRWRIAGAAGAVVLVLAVGAQVADAHTGTVGEWRFDEAGGQTAVDGGPFGLDGRLGTSAGVDAADPQRIPGVASGALRFGGGSYVQLPDAAELAQPTLSVEAVVRAPTSPGAYRYIVSRGGQGCFAGSYGLYTGAASIVFVLASVGTFGLDVYLVRRTEAVTKLDLDQVVTLLLLSSIVLTVATITLGPTILGALDVPRFGAGGL